MNESKKNLENIVNTKNKIPMVDTKNEITEIQNTYVYTFYKDMSRKKLAKKILTYGTGSAIVSGIAYALYQSNPENKDIMLPFLATISATLVITSIANIIKNYNEYKKNPENYFKKF